MRPFLLCLCLLCLAACSQQRTVIPPSLSPTPPPPTLSLPAPTFTLVPPTPPLAAETVETAPPPTLTPALTRSSAPDPQTAILHPDQPVPDLTLMPRVAITATLDGPRLSGTMQLLLTHGGPEPLPDVVLRLFSNAGTIYTGARMGVSDVQVNGQSVTGTPEAAGTALRFLLPKPLTAGETSTLTLGFETEVAMGSFRGYGIQQAASGVAVFGSPFPLLALRDGSVWRVPAVPSIGDAVSSPVALWDVSLQVLDGTRVVSTGEVVSEPSGALRILSGPARDMALVALPAETQPIEQEVAGVWVRYWPARYVGGAAFAAEDAAAVAARSVESFAAEFGPPPYDELDVVEAVVPIGGYEYPGLVLFDGEQRARADRNGIDFLVPHEVAHQWFYALVGNDVTREPWLDEGLATYAQLRYLARVRGPEAAAAQRVRWEGEYAADLARRPVGVDRPVFAYEDWVTYRGPTYYAGALLLDDLRLALGDDPFNTALRRFSARFAFREATSGDLRAVFDEAAREGGVPLVDFWARWLER